MKKVLTIALAAGLLCAVAGSAKATALETSGEIRVRAWYVDNYVADTKSTEWWDQRLRLNLVWPVAEGVKVAVRADVLEGFWGTSNDATFTVIQDATTGAVTGINTQTTGVGVRPQVSFDHVYMVFSLPGTPLSVTAGRQDVTWGPGFATKADSRDRIKAGGKFGPVSLGLAYDKNKEIFAAHGGPDDVDDGRGYTLTAVGAVAGWNIGALLAYGLDDTAPTTAKSTRITGDVYLTGKAGPVDLKAEVTYITGEDEAVGKSAIDVTGLGAYAGATVAAGPVTIGLEGAYAAGDDPSTTDKKEGGFRADYQAPFWSVILYNNMDLPGYLGSATKNAVTNDYAADWGVTNAYAGKATLSVSPMKGLTIIGAAVYAQTIEDVNITTTKTVPAVPATATTPAVPATTEKVVTTYKADPLGTEFDLVVVYNITDNVYFLGGFGYLAAGDFFGKVDDPLGAMGSLNVKF